MPRRLPVIGGDDSWQARIVDLRIECGYIRVDDLVELASECMRRGPERSSKRSRAWRVGGRVGAGHRAGEGGEFGRELHGFRQGVHLVFHPGLNKSFLDS